MLRPPTADDSDHVRSDQHRPHRRRPVCAASQHVAIQPRIFIVRPQQRSTKKYIETTYTKQAIKIYYILESYTEVNATPHGLPSEPFGPFGEMLQAAASSAVAGVGVLQTRLVVERRRHRAL